MHLRKHTKNSTGNHWWVNLQLYSLELYNQDAKNRRFEPTASRLESTLPTTVPTSWLQKTRNLEKLGIRFMFFKKAFNPKAAIMKNRKKYLEPKKLTAYRCFKWVVKMQRCVASGEPIWNEQFVRPQIPAHEKKCYFLFFCSFYSRQ